MKVCYLFLFLLAACGNSNSGTKSPVTNAQGVNPSTTNNPGQSTDKNPPSATPPTEPQPQVPTTPPDSQSIQTGMKTTDPKTKSMTVRPRNVTPPDSAEIKLKKN
jgi:hypothetical protein